MRIAINGARRQQDDNAAALTEFLRSLHAKNIEVVMRHHFYDALCQLAPEALEHVTRIAEGDEFAADAAISFGGDGTFLRTAIWVESKGIPILGVNTGHLGYLTSAVIDDLPSVPGELLTGDYTVEQRQLIQVLSPKLDTWPYALNEVVVAKYDTSSMITVDTKINGSALASYGCDGLIIATPTGSTAYNLSVGGPVLQPMIPAWVISPIAAHSLNMRPLVVDNRCEIQLDVQSRAGGFRFTLDGRTSTFPVGTTVVLRKAPFKVNLICRRGHEFPNPLRNKLLWGNR